jgi:hypothetical protein
MPFYVGALYQFVAPDTDDDSSLSNQLGIGCSGCCGTKLQHGREEWMVKQLRVKPPAELVPIMLLMGLA